MMHLESPSLPGATLWSPLPPSPVGPNPKSFRSAKNETTFPIADELQRLLFLFLETEPAVQAFEPVADGAVEVRYWGGRVLAAALPAFGLARLEAISLQKACAREGRRLVLVPERRLRRWPWRDNRGMVAECGHAVVRPAERAIIVDKLLECGGSCELGEVARLLPGSADAFAAILSLVAKCILTIVMDRPLDGRTVVSLFDPFALPGKVSGLSRRSGRGRSIEGPEWGLQE